MDDLREKYAGCAVSPKPLSQLYTILRKERSMAEERSMPLAEMMPSDETILALSKSSCVNSIEALVISLIPVIEAMRDPCQRGHTW